MLLLVNPILFQPNSEPMLELKLVMEDDDTDTALLPDPDKHTPPSSLRGTICSVASLVDLATTTFGTEAME
jgi:hypothetical protein